MEKVLLVLFLVLPICALVVLFIVRAEQLMHEDAQRQAMRDARELGGVSRRAMRAATAQAMRTDARMARMRAKYRGGLGGENLDAGRV